MKQKLTTLICIFCIIACSENGQKSLQSVNVVEYAKLTPSDFRQKIAKTPIAYLPLGTIEWHGEHLPLGSDGLQSFEFMKLLAKDVGGIVMPMLFLGPDTCIQKNGKELYGMDHIINNPESKIYYPDQQLDGSCYWVPDDLFKLIIENSIKQLARAGFKIIVAHGHGPSTKSVNKHWQEWEEKFNVMIFTCWAGNVRGKYDHEGVEKQKEGLGIMIDHAATNETSLMMYFHPELVHMENLPSDSTIWPVGVWGADPRINASAELGQQAVEFQLQRMKKVLVEALSDL